MVFDEAHIVLLACNCWDSLQHVIELHQYAIQVILLTGTIPPTSEAALKDAFGVIPNTRTIRQSCNRPELEYVQEYSLISSAISNKVMRPSRYS